MGFLRDNAVTKLVKWIKEKLSTKDSDEYFEEELEDGSRVRVSGDEISIVDSGREMRRARRYSYRSDSESKVASRAVENRYVFSDVMSDPGLVGADSEVEAVSRIAVENPGWAGFVDFESDLGVDPEGVDDAAGSGDSKAGESRHGESGEGSPGYSSDSGGDGSGVGTASESGYTPSGPGAHSDLGLGESSGGSGDGGGSGVDGGGNVGGGGDV